MTSLKIVCGQAPALPNKRRLPYPFKPARSQTPDETGKGPPHVFTEPHNTRSHQVVSCNSEHGIPHSALDRSAMLMPVTNIAGERDMSDRLRRSLALALSLACIWSAPSAAMLIRTVNMSFEGVASGNQFSPPSVSVLFAAAAPISEFEVTDVRVKGGALSDFAEQSDTQYSATLTVSDAGSGCGSVSIVIAEQSLIIGGGPNAYSTLYGEWGTCPIPTAPPLSLISLGVLLILLGGLGLRRFRPTDHRPVS